MTKILILGGTREASELASRLIADGHDVTTSLAGRTREPEPVAGNVRSGGFGGAEGLANYLRDNTIEKLIDATHQFATQISENAIRAAQLSGVAFEKHVRPPWQKLPGDHWIEVSTLEEARDKIPDGARVLLALGSQHISVFASRADVHFCVRMVDDPGQPLPLPNYHLLLAKPSSRWEEEMATLKQNNITHIVCRNSGGDGAYAKIEAARNMKLPVIIVARNDTGFEE